MEEKKSLWEEMRPEQCLIPPAGHGYLGTSSSAKCSSPLFVVNARICMSRPFSFSSPLSVSALDFAADMAGTAVHHRN